MSISNSLAMIYGTFYRFVDLSTFVTSFPQLEELEVRKTHRIRDEFDDGESDDDNSDDETKEPREGEAG